MAAESRLQLSNMNSRLYAYAQHRLSHGRQRWNEIQGMTGLGLVSIFAAMLG